MALRIELRPAAEADLDAVWSHTSEHWSEPQAVSYLKGMESVLRLLAEHPEIARLRREFNPPVRIHQYRAHLIIYTSDGTTLDVVRIVHGRANWAALLAD